MNYDYIEDDDGEVHILMGPVDLFSHTKCKKILHNTNQVKIEDPDLSRICSKCLYDTVCTIEE